MIVSAHDGGKEPLCSAALITTPNFQLRSHKIRRKTRCTANGTVLFVTDPALFWHKMAVLTPQTITNSVMLFYLFIPAQAGWQTPLF